MLPPKVPVVKDLVLLGGGHSHVEVLRSFGMRPVPGVKVTLVTKDVHTPYSGMLPGHVAGLYSYDDCHIDLGLLSNFASSTLIHAEAVSINPETREVILKNRPPVRYDVLSVDIGITPGASQIPGAADYATPVKPITRLVENLDVLLQEARQHSLEVAIVGGGAGGVELAMSLHCRLEDERLKDERPESHKCKLKIITRGNILPTHPAKARKIVLKHMQSYGIQVVEECGGVVSVEEGKLILATGDSVSFGMCWWCTDASAASWIKDTGLQTDETGFLSINEYLQSTSNPDVFAAGDIASSAKYPRPKAGVFAVRQGPPLADNLRRHLTGQPLRGFAPQSTFLSLVMTGNKHCVASKAGWCWEGDYLWALKDSIDRAFMNKYSVDLPVMAVDDQEVVEAAVASGPEAVAAIAGARRMRCGGCGAKVGASVLSRTLGRLRDAGHIDASIADDIIVGLDSPDDAAVVRSPGPGWVSVRTVDFFRDFVGDPFVFGKISANHALGDCHAMGAAPKTALAIAIVPYGLPAKVEETLFQMMAGALEVLQAAGCSLAGGHSGEGSEMALGFSVDGQAKEGEIVHKAIPEHGQAVILTKGIGTGAIMAASMQRKAQAAWVAGALGSMQQSSAAAVQCLQRHGVTACTDVTGFGLLGHLVEMARPSQVSVEIVFDDIPILVGGREVASNGVTSSLHPENLRAVKHMVEDPESLQKREGWTLLVDPQTAGGMLATVPSEAAEAAVQELRELGYGQAAVIGRAVESSNGAPAMITIK